MRSKLVRVPGGACLRPSSKVSACRDELAEFDGLEDLDRLNGLDMPTFAPCYLRLMPVFKAIGVTYPYHLCGYRDLLDWSFTAMV